MSLKPSSSPTSVKRENHKKLNLLLTHLLHKKWVITPGKLAGLGVMGWAVMYFLPT